MTISHHLIFIAIPEGAEEREHDPERVQMSDASSKPDECSVRSEQALVDSTNSTRAMLEQPLVPKLRDDGRQNQ